MTDQPRIGAFSTSKPIQLRRLSNGGWVVSQLGRDGEFPNEVGAYTTAEEMLSALSSALIGEESN